MKRTQTMWFIERVTARSSELEPESCAPTRAAAWRLAWESWRPVLAFLAEDTQAEFRRRRRTGELRAVKVTVSWEARR